MFISIDLEIDYTAGVARRGAAAVSILSSVSSILRGQRSISCPRMVDRLHIRKILEMYVHNDDTIRSKMIEASNASGSFRVRSD